MKNKKGFSLIELLVAISIIAVLTSLLTVNFIGVRERGRDGQRKASLYQIQSALELYRSDNGSYPLTASLSSCGGQFASPGGAEYMEKIPCDPTTGSAYIYTSADGSSYTIVACLENESDSEKDVTTNSACSDASFTLTNP